MPVCLEVAFAEASCLAAAVLPIPGSVCSFIVVRGRKGEGNVLPCLLRIPLALQYPREPHVSRGFTSTRRF
jgi:hypothetical protein